MAHYKEDANNNNNNKSKPEKGIGNSIFERKLYDPRTRVKCRRFLFPIAAALRLRLYGIYQLVILCTCRNLSSFSDVFASTLRQMDCNWMVCNWRGTQTICPITFGGRAFVLPLEGAQRGKLPKLRHKYTK